MWGLANLPVPFRPLPTIKDFKPTLTGNILKLTFKHL
nr:MAG TPA: hypothetical protein [Caudoviricetes sp.]